MRALIRILTRFWFSAYRFSKMKLFTGGRCNRPCTSIYFRAGVKPRSQETSPMKRTLEMLLAGVALAGLYCAVPKSKAPVDNAVLGTQQNVLVADGSDPMPVCRGRTCK